MNNLMDLCFFLCDRVGYVIVRNPAQGPHPLQGAPAWRQELMKFRLDGHLRSRPTTLLAMKRAEARRGPGIELR